MTLLVLVHVDDLMIACANVQSKFYVAIWTRYDILYAVITFRRYMEKPPRKVWYAGIHILRYLKGTDRGTRYQKGEGD